VVQVAACLRLWLIRRQRRLEYPQVRLSIHENPGWSRVFFVYLLLLFKGAFLIWQTSRFQIDLTQPRVMGIVNVTPDSFSDGGKYFQQGGGLASVFAHCAQLLKDGADMLDIGGESTRPGASPLPLNEELARVLPVLRHAVQLGVPVSVDTYKPEVMQEALNLGADVINDIWALRQPGALEVVARHPACGVCLMHMHREPQTMQAEPMHGDVVAQVFAFLENRAKTLEAVGISPDPKQFAPG
jgi:dihydropteroate synthase